MSEPGAEQDDAASDRWLLRVRSKHKLARFAPPFASCKCGGWQQHAPNDLGITRQRDYLLDSFLEHRKFMSSERRRLFVRTVG
jgi:hypothetical protein